MQGTSRAALAASREALESALRGGADGTATANDLFAVADVLGDNPALRRAIVDPSREGEARAQLVQRLFGPRLSASTVSLLSTMASQRWAHEGDLGETVSRLGAEALLSSAEKNGRLDRVEDELFEVERRLGAEDEVRAALIDRRAPRQSKAELVTRLLNGKVAPETLRLVEQAVSGAKSRRFDIVLKAYREIASVRRQQLTAVVTSAVALDDSQRDRLARALGEIYGRAVRTNVVIDPEVVGGLKVEIGDDIIDGTVSRRLDEARAGMVG